MRRSMTLLALVSAGALTGCTAVKSVRTAGSATFGDDVAFARKSTLVVVLSGSEGRAAVAVAPKLQGRVLTSTSSGQGGMSFGWINRALLAEGRPRPQINCYGGEDRFWIGPEGGQFSIFFSKGASFDMAHWFTPAPIDTEAFDVVSSSAAKIVMKKDMQLTNYAGTTFKLKVDREVRVIDTSEACQLLGLENAEGLETVGFESANTMTNTGDVAWDKATGLLSIWILGMFQPGTVTSVAIPFTPGPDEELGPKVNDAYFGKVPEERLSVTDGAVVFVADGKCRSKIGVSPRRAKSVLGSYDALNGVLTIVQYNKPEGKTDYVNSLWQEQENPYGGDAVNAYNDGPASPGAKPLGPFYEMETSSPAAALQPGESIQHIHRTFHFTGPEPVLNAIAMKALGVSVPRMMSVYTKVYAK
ncbi:MAG: hypothetical protein A3K18_30565 [Lentisphaerae bacterium RIFOXYA12_64_32]|nr:MAG: hypothetical protein A3K18_30565 [Lentisphaerae bacterium RIFOXYA12_64_32]